MRARCSEAITDGFAMNPKTRIFFGPPLALLTEGQNNTLEISGKINRTAERYLEIMRHHGLDLSQAERDCIAHVCEFGFMGPQEIGALAFDVKQSEFQCERLDKEALAAKLETASFADLVAVVEELGF
ncbi:MAG: hypothetical protein A3H32_18460 [Betaproteobacteria bacterium RIFCSPLOWO2_02_FULL_63_19]|nr:MAG: hypothetical protein A3H32_18460 [Betaproteobacteria bacterium RIFCSPLOWO2_02_FULL_63_19]